MKRVISLLCAMFMVIGLVGCSAKEEAPESVVESYCAAMKRFDIVAMNQYLVDYTEESSTESSDDDMPTLVGFFTDCCKKIKYETLSVTTTESESDVRVRFTYPDVTELAKEVLAEYLRQAFALAFTDPDADTNKLMDQIFAEKSDSVKTGTAEATVTFHCIKADGVWKIKEEPDEVPAVMTANFSKIAEELDDMDENDSEEESEEETEEELVWEDVALNQTVELATVKIKLTECKEVKELKGEFLETEAQEGTKFVVISATVENITSSSIEFNNDLPLKDSQGRSYEPYSDAYWYVENSFNYEQLAPNIPMTGVFVYNVPTDCSGYYLQVYKADTNLAFNLLTK